MFSVKRAVAPLFLCALFLSSCQTANVLDPDEISSFGDSAASVDDISLNTYYPNEQLVKEGLVQIREKNYGKSYTLFKKAVEVYPDDPLAWLGYSASADHLSRFKNADIGYRRLARMIPNTPTYLNNVGYSYLLRGNLRQARTYFLRAYEIDHSNETTTNNLELLRNSASFVKRG